MDRPRVVAHLSDGSLAKGFLVFPKLDHTDSVLTDFDQNNFEPEIILKPVDDGEEISIPTTSLKALFFVRTFEGDKKHNEVKFFDGHPRMAGLWVRVEFKDGETTEGVARNSVDILNCPGFFLKPPDPTCNNDIIYVVRSSLKSFVVLGVKQDF